MRADTAGWHTLRCEKCGRKQRKNVVYGYPSPELQEEAQHGDAVLAGCGIGEPLGPWWCADCEPTIEELEPAKVPDVATRQGRSE